MKARFWLPSIGALAVLCACSTEPVVPSGTLVLDEEVALVRSPEAALDVATRELAVADDSILVAIVDEQLTDVRLELSATASKAVETVEVENHLGGAGLEVAEVSVPEGARVLMTVSGARDGKLPGKVRLRVRQYAADAARDPRFASELGAYGAWSRATSAGLRGREAKATAGPGMLKAIEGFAGPNGDAVLVAQARLVRANLLHHFKIDWRESRVEAQRAATAFATLPTPDLLPAARANCIEALALSEIANDRDARDPTADEAKLLARAALERLSAPESPFGPIERARALTALGRLELAMSRAPDAQARYQEARALYVAQGHASGEREMRYHLATLLVEEGKFADAAQAFMTMVDEVGLIANPEIRVNAWLNAARGLSFSGRFDEGAELMLKALPVAREFELREQEASALQGLGYLYQNRGDVQQSAEFLSQALEVARESNDVGGYVTALASAGAAARTAGDFKRAIELHEEAVRKAPTPVLQVRNRFELGMDHYRNDETAKGMAIFREALAIDLNDPASHIYTDGKLCLAIFIAEVPGSTEKDFAEADRLIAEALATSLKVRDEWRVIFAARAQGQLDQRRGNLAKARASYEKVLTMSRAFRERSSSSTEARSSMLNDEERAFRSYLDIVLADVARRGAGKLAPATADQLAGLQRLERARQGSFGALRVGTLDARSSARVEELLGQMASKGLRIATLVNGPDAAQKAELRKLQGDMAGLHAELDQLRASAAARHAQTTAAAVEGPRSWRALAPGAVQISFAAGSERVYALVRGATGTQVTVLAPTRKDLEQRLTELAALDSRSKPGEFEQALELVSGELLPAGLLAADTSSVEIVAEGRIASVPFPALRSPSDPKRRLIETHDIAMVTSLFAGDEAPRPRQARPFRFVALASGSGAYRAAAVVDPAPRLQAATKEIEIAAGLFAARDPRAKVKLFTGADGTAAALREVWASGADVVHFATHALADLRQPVASLLVLPATDAAGKSTYLTAGQVQAWRGDTELVFLSACESAVGPPQFAAGMPGLQLAFLRAGARGVIATLAPIEDVLAQRFSEDFYQRYTGGVTAERALAETQRAWLAPRAGASDAELMRRRLTALSHAYYEN